MSRDRRVHKRDRYQMVPTDQMVPADPVTQQLSLDAPEPPESQGGGYWERATGKAHTQPVVTQQKREGIDPSGEGREASGSGADYWDRTRGAEYRRPVLPERPALPSRPAAAVWVAPEVAVTPVQLTGDPVVTNEDQKNTVTGTKSGQCAGSGF